MAQSQHYRTFHHFSPMSLSRLMLPCPFLLCVPSLLLSLACRSVSHGSLSLFIDFRGVYSSLPHILGYSVAISGVCDLVKTGWAGGQDKAGPRLASPPHTGTTRHSSRVVEQWKAWGARTEQTGRRHYYRAISSSSIVDGSRKRSQRMKYSD